MEEWSTFRLTGAALTAFGDRPEVAGAGSPAGSSSGSREAATRG
jgi:hypothetical protein